MKWLIACVILVAAMVVFSLVGGRGHATAVVALGSTSVQPFAGMLAQEFKKTHPDSIVDVEGGGSTAGLVAAASGVADIGTCSRALKDDEAKVFQFVVIARDGLAVVVHPSNPVNGLTREEICHLFAGAAGYDNWKSVGGLDEPVRLITREEGSGTREAFQKLIMGKTRISRRALNQESNGSVMELVKHDRCAIGYMSLGLVKGQLKVLTIDGQTPSAEAVKAGRYSLVRPFLFVTKGPPSPKAQQFIDFVLSPSSQRTLEEEGLISAQ